MWPAKKPESTMPMFIPVPEYPAAYANSAPIDSMPLSLRNSGVRQLAGSPTRPGSPAYVVIGGGGADSCACAGCVANSGSATSSAVATRLVVDRRPPPESWPLTALKNTCEDGGPSQAQPLGSDQGLADLGRAARRRGRSRARGGGRRGRSAHRGGGGAVVGGAADGVGAPTGAVAGALVYAPAEAIMRARLGPADAPPLWQRILGSALAMSLLGALLGVVFSSVVVAILSGALLGVVGLRPLKVALGV